MRSFLILAPFAALTLLAQSVFGAGGHGHEGVPLDKIAWQAANLGVLLFAMIFFLRKSIAETFASRKSAFLAQSEKTKSALKNAEIALSGIKQKLSSLESGEAQAYAHAQSEAARLKTNLIAEAEQAAEKLKKDAGLLVANELTKAKTEINQIILEKALSGARQALAQKQNGTAQEAAFIKQLEQVKA